MTLPPGVAEGSLLAVLVGAGALILRSVRRRKAFLKAAPDSELPDLTTSSRLTVTLRRVWQDGAQHAPVVEAQLAEKRRLVFCPTDHARVGARYTSGIGKPAELALFGLASLSAGGVEAMRDQIRDIDEVEITPDMVRLIHAGQFANDYVVIGRVLSWREDTWGELPLWVYRVQCVRAPDLTLVIELACPKTDDPPLPDDTMAHGSARLFGYLS